MEKLKNFVDVNDLNQWEQQNSLKVSSSDDLKQKITVLINHREIVEGFVKKVDLFTENDTDLGKTNTIKMRIDTGNHPSIKLRPYRTPFSKCEIVDKALNDMLAENIIHPSRPPWSFPIVLIGKRMALKGSVLT